jgi:hypothetical protein
MKLSKNLHKNMESSQTLNLLQSNNQTNLINPMISLKSWLQSIFKKFKVKKLYLLMKLLAQNKHNLRLK